MQIEVGPRQFRIFGALDGTELAEELVRTRQVSRSWIRGYLESDKGSWLG
jgi:hypothetical protein